MVFTPEQRAMVANLTAVGVTQEQIAGDHLKIDLKTLRAHFRAELDTAAQQANAVVVGRLFAMTKSNVAAAIFWLKNRSKDQWKDSHGIEGNLGFSFAKVVEDSMKKDKGKPK